MKNKKWMGVSITGIIVGLVMIAILVNSIFAGVLPAKAADSPEYIYIGQWQWIIEGESGYWRMPRADIGNWVIDLRSIPQMSIAGGKPQGYCIFSLKQRDDAVGTFITEGITGYVDALKRADMQNKLKLSEQINSTNTRDIIWELLTVHADESGEVFAKPLMPTIDLRMNLILGGEIVKTNTWTESKYPKVIDLLQLNYRALREDSLAVGSNLYLKYLGTLEEKYKLSGDTFIPEDLPIEKALTPETTIGEDWDGCGDSDDLDCDLSWTEVYGSGDIDIVSNKAQIVATGGAYNMANARAESALSSDDQRVWADFDYLDSGGAPRAGVAARFHSTNSSYYLLEALTNNYMYITKVVNNVRTGIDSYDDNPDNGDEIQLEYDGSTYTYYLNDVELDTGTDSSITGNLYTGIDGYANTNGHTLDNFGAEDLEAGVSAPTVVTGNATSITCNSANGTGNVTATGGANVTYWGIQYGQGSLTDNVSDTGSENSTFNFSLEITGLSPSTEYMTRAFAENSEGIAYGSSVNFTTSASANPTVTTNNATSILYLSAQLNAMISGLTCDNASDIMFEWGTAPSTYTANWTDTGNWGNESFNHTPTLSANTTYYYRGGAALSGSAWQYGSEVSFYTLTYGTPSVVTGNATSIDYTSVTGQGNIIDTGNTTISIRGFQYGIGDFSANVSQSSGPYSTGNYSISITSLSAGTEYQYRAFIYSDELAGYYFGSSVNFTTLAYTAPAVTTNAATGVTDNDATLNGNITDDGGATCNVTFFWDTTDHAQSANWTYSANYTGQSAGAISHGITNTLSPETLYYSNIRVVNVAGTAWGSSVNFTTTATPEPAPAGVTNTSSIISEKEDATITLVATALPIVYFTGLGLWKYNSPCLMLASGSSMIMGFRWYDLDYSGYGLSLSLVFWFFSIACLALALVILFKRNLAQI